MTLYAKIQSADWLDRGEYGSKNEYLYCRTTQVEPERVQEDRYTLTTRY